MTGNNVMVPLDGLMDDENWGLGSENLRFDAPKKDEIIPQFLSEGKINGVQYAIPFMRSTEACYINVDMVKALGYDGVPELITWDWIFEVSEAAMALGKDGDGNYKLNGQKVLIPFIYKSTDNMMIQMLKQKGAGYSTDDGEILIFNDETEDILYEIAGHTKTGAFSTFKISSYPGNYLNAGQCIFAIDSTAGATWMGPEAPQIDIAEENLIDCEIAVRAIPQYDTEDPQMISQGPSICIFNKENSKEVMASWIFVQYLLTNEVQIAYSQTEGYLPVTSKAHSSPEYQSYLSKSGEDNDLYYHVKIDAAKLLLNNLDNTFITPVFNGSASLRNAAGQMIEEVVKSIRRKQTVDDKYMKDLYERVSTLYHLDELNMKSGVKINFGALPKGSLALITVIGTVWVAIGAYYVVKLIKKHKNIE
jgi:multiple sugar transport system substrate-binding protein